MSTWEKVTADLDTRFDAALSPAKLAHGVARAYVFTLALPPQAAQAPHAAPAAKMAVAKRPRPA